MISEQTKTELKSFLPAYLDELQISTSKKINCINPNHEDRNASMSYDKKREILHCFSCVPSTNLDLFDLIAVKELGAHFDSSNKPIYKFSDALNYAIKHFGVKAKYTQSGIISNAKGEKNKVKQKQDYTSYYKQVQKDLDKASVWLSKRGIELDTAREYGLGYDKKFNRLIIPRTKNSYTGRALENNTEPKYSNSGSEVALFNSEVLKSDDFVFVVEGSFDALSIIQSGYKAVSIESVTNARKLLNLLDKQENKAVKLLLALDNDEKGRQATAELIKELQDTKITYRNVSSELYGKYKDANEFLANDSERFEQQTKKVLELVKSELMEKIKEMSAYNSIQTLVDEIANNAKRQAISTGFTGFNNLLDGGFFSGLYVLGAISSLGKTTLALQIADNIAKNDNDVLIISLEMSKFELMAKSLSRESYIQREQNTAFLNKNTNPPTTRTILNGSKFLTQNADTKELFKDATKSYSKYAKNVYIFEGLGDIGVQQIREIIDNHKSYTGNAPTVFIDYLQILAPYNERYTDKQNTDKNIMELKRISRDYDCAIFGISSFNRDSYSKSVSMASFKESGAIEYSSDVLLGLEFSDMGTNADDNKKSIEENKAKETRKVTLKILKNRNGRTGSSVDFNFKPMYNFFEEQKTSSRTTTSLADY